MLIVEGCSLSKKAATMTADPPSLRRRSAPGSDRVASWQPTLSGPRSSPQQDQLPASDQVLVLDMVDRFLQDVTARAADSDDVQERGVGERGVEHTSDSTLDKVTRNVLLCACPHPPCLRFALSALPGRRPAPGP